MSAPHVYDKADYHREDVKKHGRPVRHAAHHVAQFLRWLLERGLLAPDLLDGSSEEDASCRSGATTLLDLFERWDECLVSDMLTDEGNRFALQYFEVGNGRYAEDYAATIAGELPTICHVPWNEESWRRLAPVIGRHYDEFRRPKRRWWPFGGAPRS